MTQNINDNKIKVLNIRLNIFFCVSSWTTGIK